MAAPKYSYQNLLRMLEGAGIMPASERIQESLRLAFDGHGPQFREARTSKERIPFILHPVGTALKAIEYFPMVENVLTDNLETVVCVALTHDLLEDTSTDQAMVERVAGPEVRRAVEALTKPPAGVIGKGKDTRNAEFADQIANAGPTAVFVKLCDSMHNMSRPNQTPPRLFRKAVDKARKLYLPLLDRCPLGQEFEQVYQRALSTAEQNAMREEQFAREQPPPRNLDDVAKECVAASAGKVLELHDITGILHRVAGTQNASIWRVGGKEADVLTLVSSSDSSAFEEDVCRRRVSDSPEILKGQEAAKFPLALKSGQDASIYLIPMQIGLGRSFVAVLVFDPPGAPNWLTLDAAALMAQFLAHRLIVSELDRKSRVTMEAARLGIQVDAELAAESGLTPPDLLRLNRWRTRCQQAVKGVEGLINFYLLSNASRDESLESVRVESRVKTVNSILDKLVHRVKRSISRFEELEDIAGVRVVCPTIAIIRSIQSFLTSEKAITAGCRLHPLIDRPERDWISEATKEGYRAVHLVMEVDTFLEDEGPEQVPCEVQLRTVFQDIWAKIAHKTAYGTTAKNPRLDIYLQEMGAALQRCEEIAECIAKDHE